MRNCEKEADDILFTVARNMKDGCGFHESAKTEIAQALKTKQDEIERLKEEISNFQEVIVPAWKKDEADSKKSEKALLETINQQGDEIKELKKGVSRWQKDFGIAGRKVTSLESKIAVAREALRSLKNAVTFTTPTQINGVAVYEALVPVGFVEIAKQALAELGEE